MQVYIVQKGDTLWGIAKKYRITVGDILRVNPGITNPDKIYPGQSINIPVGLPGGGNNPGGSGFIYTVVAGDSMWSIAQRYGISLDQLIRANPQIKNPNSIMVGQRIFIPMNNNINGNQTYTVVKGDSMWLIAKRFGISLNELIRANPQIPNPNLIYPGQVLVIPGGYYPPVPPMPPMPPAPPVPPVPPISNDTNGKLYYVKSGDTFFNIAQRFGINMDSLIKTNLQINDASQIAPGMQIYLPGTHYVRAGQSLYSIAQSYGVNLEELIIANPQISNPNDIQVGQKVYIPMSPGAMMGYYTVQSGDTLSRIAQMYNITVEAIMLANNNTSNPDMIFPGQLLVIPGVHIAAQGQTLSYLAKLYNKRLSDVIEANPQITNPNMILPGQHVIIPVGTPIPVPTIPTPPRPEPRVESASAEAMDYIAEVDSGMYNVEDREQISSDDEQDSQSDDGCSCGRDSATGVTSHPIIYKVAEGDTLYSIANKFKVTVRQIMMANPTIKNADSIYPGENILILPVNMVCEYRCLDCPWLRSNL